jgi:DNA polymerase I
MSEFGLSKTINITLKQAREYIDSYFLQYPGIKSYMMNTKSFCKERGYVNTLFGRRFFFFILLIKVLDS